MWGHGSHSSFLAWTGVDGEAQMEPVALRHTRKILCQFNWLVGGSKLVAISSGTERLSTHSVYPHLFQPLITLEGSISFKFTSEGMNTITVQVSAGNAILQDTKTIAVYGECPCASSPGWTQAQMRRCACRVPEATRPLPRERRIVEKEPSQVWSRPLGEMWFTSTIMVTRPREHL